MHSLFFFKVTGDIEGSDNAVRRPASPSQSSASRRHDQECTRLPTRKRRFKSEWDASEGRNVHYTHTLTNTHTHTHTQTYTYTHRDCVCRLPEERTHSAELVSCQTPETSNSHALPTCCLPKSHRFVLWFVPPGCHRVEPVGGSGCGSIA